MSCAMMIKAATASLHRNRSTLEFRRNRPADLAVRVAAGARSWVRNSSSGSPSASSRALGMPWTPRPTRLVMSGCLQQAARPGRHRGRCALECRLSPAARASQRLVYPGEHESDTIVVVVVIGEAMRFQVRENPGRYDRLRCSTMVSRQLRVAAQVEGGLQPLAQPRRQTADAGLENPGAYAGAAGAARRRHAGVATPRYTVPVTRFSALRESRRSD